MLVQLYITDQSNQQFAPGGDSHIVTCHFKN